LLWHIFSHENLCLLLKIWIGLSGNCLPIPNNLLDVSHPVEWVKGTR
jgi:hypothetical protein